jgi:multidrug efflux pump subunit AcrA (membrane-fusion protein)
MTRKSKRLLGATVIPALIIAGLVSWFLIFVPQDATASTGAAVTEIVEVEILVKQEGIEISGNIEPVNSANLAFPIAGYIDAIYVEEGDLIEAGTVLALLGDSQQRYDLASVVMEIDSENVTGTKRNLGLLELKLEMTQASLEDTQLSSTISGLVTSVDAEVGDYVTAMTAGASADVVVRVIDRSAMTALVEVDELDAPYLAIGQKVLFQFDAYPDLEVIGEVSLVPLEARTTTQGIAVLDAEVTILDPPEEILPFFTFAGEIFLDDSEAVLLIPEDAVITRGDRSMVMQVVSNEDGVMGGIPGGIISEIDLPEGYSAIPAQVNINAYGSGRVQVISGLEAGDRILLTTTGIPVTSTTDATESGEEEGGANVLEMLGMPSGGNGGGPGGGGSPPPSGNQAR